MKLLLILTCISIPLFFSCENSIKKPMDNNSLAITDSVKQNPALDSGLVSVNDSLAMPVKPVFGYRFTLEGDFNGDGKKEKLVEHYFSRMENKEANKFYENITEYEDFRDSIVNKRPYSFLISDNKQIDTLRITDDGYPSSGLSFIKNEGDLNGDGTDEISYVIDWADYSSCNYWHLVTYKNRKWKELFSFSIRDWQLPNLPEAVNEYGYFGVQNKIVNSTDTVVNNEIEKELNKFEGLVKKIKTNKIQVIYMNEEAEEDTATINLKHPKLPKHVWKY